jgi:hypothetical protein
MARSVPITQDFVVTRGLVFHGTVREDHGKAVEGAVLRIIRPTEDPAWRSGIIASKTRHDGSFEVPGLLPLAYSVIVDPPTPLDQEYAAVGFQINALNPDPMDIVLPRKGVENLAVRLPPSRPESAPIHLDIRSVRRGSPPETVASKVLFDHELEAKLKVPPGDYVLVALSADGASGELGPFTVPDGTATRVDVTLHDGAKITGNITDQNGKPVAPDRILFERWSESLTTWIPLTFMDRKEGRASPLHAGESGGFTATVPTGRLRIKVGGRVVQETSCVSDMNIGRIVAQESP